MSDGYCHIIKTMVSKSLFNISIIYKRVLTSYQHLCHISELIKFLKVICLSRVKFVFLKDRKLFLIIATKQLTFFETECQALLYTY